MPAADYRILTDATGQRIAAALEAVSAMVGPPGEVSEAELTAKLAEKADVIVDTASGAIASFPDGMAAPAKDVTIGIKPVQAGSGDPSPTNVRPISGWTGANVTRTGKNLFDPNDAFEYIDCYSVNGTSQKRCGYILNYPAGSYKISATRIIDSNAYIYLNVVNADGSFSSFSYLVVEKSINFQSVSLADGQYIILYDAQATVDGSTNDRFKWFNIQIELGSTATAYEPYTGAVYPISWQSEAGTVYGGTLDVTTGLLTVTHGNIASYNGESLPGEWISSMDVYSAGGTPTTGAQVVYELATPQTYQLTPTEVELLLGNNNVWADTGDSTVTYRADTKLYVQKINAPTDDDMIADAQIASGKYFIVGGNLYKSTTTIPAGDTINPGTNCILTNLAEALNALNT